MNRYLGNQPRYWTLHWSYARRNIGTKKYNVIKIFELSELPREKIRSILRSRKVGVMSALFDRTLTRGRQGSIVQARPLGDVGDKSNGESRMTRSANQKTQGDCTEKDQRGGFREEDVCRGVELGSINQAAGRMTLHATVDSAVVQAERRRRPRRPITPRHITPIEAGSGVEETVTSST